METITFYSYKGGVGRSLALSHIAERFSELEQMVFLIDFDLEAPGLHYKFKKEIDKAINSGGLKKGLVDYLYTFFSTNKSEFLPDNFNDYFYELKFDGKSKIGKVYLMTAGMTTKDDYWKKLAYINWSKDFVENDRIGMELLIDLKARIKKEINPQYLLIDSRTGISDISTLTLKVLADKVVVLAANNFENLDGAHTILKTLNSPSNYWNNKPKSLLLALSRFPRPKNNAQREREKILINDLKLRFVPRLVEDQNFVVLHEDSELLWEEKKIIDIKGKLHFELKEDYFKLLAALTRNLPESSLLTKIQNKEKAEFFFGKAVDAGDNLTDARSFIDMALKLNPLDSQYYLFKSQILYDEEKFKEAIATIEEGLSIDQSNFKLYARNCLNKISIKDKKGALADINIALELQPKDAFLFTVKGWAFRRFGEYEEAIKMFDLSLSMDETDAYTYSFRGDSFGELAQPEKALQDYNKAIELDPTNSNFYRYRATVNKTLKNNENALLDFTKSIELDPSNPEGYLERSEIYLQKGFLESALNDVSVAISLDVTISEYYIARAYIYNRLKKYVEAIDDYNKAIDLNSTEASYYSGRGNVYYNLENYSRALLDYSKSIQLDPLNAQNYLDRSDVYVIQNSIDLAKQDLDLAIELNASISEFYAARAEIWRQLDKIEEAIEDYSKAISLEPKNSDYYECRASVYELSGHHSKAIDDYINAISYNPNISFYYNELAKNYVSVGQLDLAMDSVNKALTIEENGFYYGTKAEIYSLLNDKESMYDNITKALELEPNAFDDEVSKYLIKYKNEKPFIELIAKAKQKSGNIPDVQVVPH